MRIVELRLFTDNLEEQLEFYHSLLGFPLVDRRADLFSVQVGETVLSFMQYAGKEMPFYHFAINISENKIEKALQWLETRVRITEGDGNKIIDFQSWNAHSIYFDDPAGNIVELIARHNVKNASEEGAFTLDDFQHIDEIGLSFSDVLTATEIIKREFKLDNWKQPSSQFAPIGGEDGLFITAKLGRTWYMSNKAAENFPLEVTFLGSENKQVNLNHYILRSVQ